MLRTTSRYIHPAIQCSPHLSSLKRRVNVLFLEWCAKAIPQQVNYLVDEASDVGKGANTSISYVHHYFEHHGLTETSAHLHAVICSGQNKNNYFTWYLAWRTILQLHQLIRYSCLTAGHTKFGSDSCFGIIKKSCKLSYISSLYEFANMVELSSSAINKHSLWGHNSYRPSICLVLISWRVLLISPFLILQRRTQKGLFERAQFICWTVVNAFEESCNPLPRHAASSQTESSRVEPRTKVVFVRWNQAFL